MLVGPTMGFDHGDGVLVVVHRDLPPTSDEWRTYCALTHENRTRWQGALIYTLGGGPNSAQREEVRKAFAGERPPPMAVLTGSALVRGIITSLNWFLNDQLAAFALHDLPGAARHVGMELRGEQARRVITRIDGIAQAMAVPLAWARRVRASASAR